MSGLELLGAVSAAATLVDLGRKISKQLLKVQGAHGDPTAQDLHKRVVTLKETIAEVHNFLLRLYTQNAKHRRITKPEEEIWKRIEAVFKECEEKLAELHGYIEIVLARSDSFIERTKESMKLSAFLPDIQRTQGDIDTYIKAIESFKSLLQIISSYKQEALQRTIHHDVRQIKGRQNVDMHKILEELVHIKKKLPERQSRPEQPEPFQDEKSTIASGLHYNGDGLGTDEADPLNVNLEYIWLAVEEDVKSSFTRSETTSVRSGTPFSSNSIPDHSSASSNQPETQSIPSTKLESYALPLQRDTFPDVTHLEPLKRLAQRLKEQAQSDLDQGAFQCAENHQRESIKCFEELHNVHAVPFDLYQDMQSTLAKVFKERKHFSQWQEVLQRLQQQRNRYDSTLGCHKVETKFDDDAKKEARTAYDIADGYTTWFRDTKELNYLMEAEKHAKRAFFLQREILGRFDPEVKRTAKLLVEIYLKYPNKHLYADTYDELYLSGSDPELEHDTIREAPLSPPRSKSITTSDLFQAIVSHQQDDLQSLVNMIKEASESGTNLNEKMDEKSAMMLAVECGLERCERCDMIIEALCRAGANRDEPFQYAIEIGGDRATTNCNLLLDHGAKIDRPDSSLFTPLMNAVRNQNLELVDFLIEKGADRNISGERGRTVLHLATQKNDPVIMKALLRERKSLLIDAQDIDGLTALHLCVKNSKPKLALRLIRAEADLDIRDRSSVKRTPLWIAVKEGKCEFAEMLLDSDAMLDLDYLPVTDANNDMRNLLRRKQKEKRKPPNG